MESLHQTSLVHMIDSQKTHSLNVHVFYLFSNEILTFVFSSITAENLGFTSYQPAYLSKRAKGKNLLGGVNFASAASGYFDATAKLYVKTLKAK